MPILTYLKIDAIPNLVYWCSASKHRNEAWLTYLYEWAGNHETQREVIRILLTNHAIRAEKISNSDQERPENAQKHASS